jgi:hypothetical protein
MKMHEIHGQPNNSGEEKTSSLPRIKPLFSNIQPVTLLFSMASNQSACWEHYTERRVWSYKL